MKKNYVVVAVGLGLAQLGLQQNKAQAQSAKLTDSTKTLNEVVVTASRSPKKLSEIGRVVTVITADEISRSQGKTVPQLLNSVAGITFSGSQNNIGISSSLYLRGASVGNTLILIDGFPVNNAGSVDGSYDLNAFSLDQIDHIEILKGSGSTLYGSDAVAGVINIITKHAEKQGLKASVQLSGGSYNTFKQSAALTGRLNKTGIALNLSNTDAGGFPAATDTLGNQGFKNDGYHQRSVNLNLNQQVTNKFTLNGNLQTSYNYGDLPDGAFASDPDYTYHNTFLFGGIGARLQLPKGALQLNLSQNTVWNKFLEVPSSANGNTSYEGKNIGRITNTELVYNQTINKYLDITSGAGFKYSNTSQFSYFKEPGYDPGPSISNADTTNNSITSVFTSLFFKSGIFHTELGGRYNNHSKYGSNFTYTFNPSVVLANQLKLFGTIASAFKAPSLYQLYSEYGNINLKPEVTTSYELGFDWQIQSPLSFNAVFYKRKTTDVIYFYTDQNYRSYYRNGDLEDDKGFETELKYNANGVTASAYAAYATGTQTDTKGVDTHNLLRRPRNTYGASVAYDVTKVFSFSVNYKYTGQRSDMHYYGPPTYASIAEGLAAYNLVDLHVQANATKKLSLYIDLNNLFNQKYIDWIGYNTRGFNMYGGLKYQIN